MATQTIKNKKITKLVIFYRKDMVAARDWEKKIVKWLGTTYPKIKILSSKKTPSDTKRAPDLVIALGGDGSILEAAHHYHKWGPLVMGLNLGQVGFIASVREEENFLKGIDTVLKGNFRADPRLMILATLVRKNKPDVKFHSLNDISVQSLSGMVKLKVSIENYPFQYINGSGVLVATATGSTAYNLSLHGPIVMPNIRCFIITEIADHNIPTPSIVINRDRTITVDVEDFRKLNRFLIAGNRKKVDVALFTDGYKIIPLEKGDEIIIRESKKTVRFVELDKHYFFKSVQEKFAF
jgi:NAD+ kinase